MKTVFITRNLTADSVFKKQLELVDLKVYGKSLIQFSVVPFNKIPKVDWIFFYSKNAVKFFFQSIEQSRLKIPDHLKWAVIGAETAKALTSKFKTPDFIGEGSGELSADSFLKIAKGQKVLFPQAESSLKAIQKKLEKEIIAFNLIVYRNIPKIDLNIPSSDFVAFTSPLNAKTYFKNRQTEPNQKLFAIGQSTARTLIDLGISDFEIATSPSEEALAKAIIKNLKSIA